MAKQLASDTRCSKNVEISIECTQSSDSFNLRLASVGHESDAEEVGGNPRGCTRLLSGGLSGRLNRIAHQTFAPRAR